MGSRMREDTEPGRGRDGGVGLDGGEILHCAQNDMWGEGGGEGAHKGRPNGGRDGGMGSGLRRNDGGGREGAHEGRPYGGRESGARGKGGRVGDGFRPSPE